MIIMEAARSKDRIGVIIGSEIRDVKSITNTLRSLKVEFDVSGISVYANPDRIKPFVSGDSCVYIVCGLPNELVNAIAGYRPDAIVIDVKAEGKGIPVNRKGMPVAAVSSQRNGALFAAGILARGDAELLERLQLLRGTEDRAASEDTSRKPSMKPQPGDAAVAETGIEWVPPEADEDGQRERKENRQR